MPLVTSFTLMASPIPSPASAFLKAPEFPSDHLWTVPFECPAGPLNPSSAYLQMSYVSHVINDASFPQPTNLLFQGFL